MSEVSPPSHEQDQPHEQAFNLGALSVSDIVRLNMALRLEEQHQFDEREPRPTTAETERDDYKLINMLRGAMKRLVSDDLDRAKEVITALRDDHSPANTMGYSQELAAELTPALIVRDYEFSRDTLLAIRYDDRTGHPGENPSAADTAVGTMTEFEERLTPEQRADYDLHVQRYETGWLPPGGPD